MHDLDLRALRFRLLRGGVAPKHVRRTITELRHHLADLEQNAVADGASRENAADQALERIGNQQQIIEATLARPELKSWAYRWPWGIYGFLPFIATALAMVGSIALCVGVMNLAQSLAGLDDAAFGHAMGERPWVQALLAAWAFGTAYILPVAFAGLLCVMAARRDAPVFWPAVGVLLILFLGFSFNMSFMPPKGPDGQATLTAGIGIGMDRLINVQVLRLLVPLAAVLVPYYLWRRRQSADMHLG